MEHTDEEFEALNNDWEWIPVEERQLLLTDLGLEPEVAERISRQPARWVYNHIHGKLGAGAAEGYFGMVKSFETITGGEAYESYWP